MDTTIKIHVTENIETGQCRYHRTRTGLERDRALLGADGFRYIVGVEVPVGSTEARAAFTRWLTEAA